jgi:hypothetical protein
VTLDLARVITSISEMVATVDPEHERYRFDALRSIWNTLDPEDLDARLDHAGVTFLTIRQTQQIRDRIPLPAIPANYAVAATDGSMILPDRHSPARFYLLNIGLVYLRYGSDPMATLTSEPILRFGEDELFVRAGPRRMPINETILGLRRAVAELQAAVDLLEGEPLPAIALVDGTLILWMLESLDDEIVESLLPDFLKVLSVLEAYRIPVAGYISSPGATDLFGALRVAACDYPDHHRDIDCMDCWRRIMNEGHTAACDILPRVTDRYVIEQVANLQPGERSAAFPSESKILSRYHAKHRVWFCYVHTGREIARVEVPRWVADDPELLDRVHAIVWDQAQLGRGYPVALQEAHEQAVLSMGDRRLVEETVERVLASQGVVVTRTGKDGSKRGRFV